MKVLLRNILINLLTFYLVDLIYPGFAIEHTTKTLLTASVAWLILNKIVKPIIKLLLLPINLITLNLFSWVVSLVTLLILQAVVEKISITAYDFPGLTWEGFVIPAIGINLLFSYLITSSLLNSIHNFIMWLIRKDDQK